MYGDVDGCRRMLIDVGDVERMLMNVDGCMRMYWDVG